MSEATPNRTITGLGAPRARSGGVHPDASRLLARNRPPVGATTPVATVAPTQPPKTKEQLNVAVPVDVRRRIRAAYRATAPTEGHRTFSDLVAAVLEKEARRLEATYNQGRPFTGGEQALPGGRPLED